MKFFSIPNSLFIISLFPCSNCTAVGNIPERYLDPSADLDAYDHAAFTGNLDKFINLTGEEPISSHQNTWLFASAMGNNQHITRYIMSQPGFNPTEGCDQVLIALSRKGDAKAVECLLGDPRFEPSAGVLNMAFETAIEKKQYFVAHILIPFLNPENLPKSFQNGQPLFTGISEHEANRNENATISADIYEGNLEINSPVVQKYLFNLLKSRNFDQVFSILQSHKSNKPFLKGFKFWVIYHKHPISPAIQNLLEELIDSDDYRYKQARVAFDKNIIVRLFHDHGCDLKRQWVQKILLDMFDQARMPQLIALLMSNREKKSFLLEFLNWADENHMLDSHPDIRSLLDSLLTKLN